MKNFIKSNLLYLIGGALGAIGGYVYYAVVGCQSGTCPITASPVMSVLWGAAMGGLILSMFNKKKKKDENNH
ncbi:MAG: DUF6132 family protein [Alistipes sp.]